MPAYVIFIRERTIDQSELDAYAKLAPASLEGLPIKFLAAYGRQEVLEGPVPEGVAIAEFPSLEEAKQWYESPAYQAAAHHRFKGATYRASLLKAFNSEGRARRYQLCLQNYRSHWPRISPGTIITMSTL